VSKLTIELSDSLWRTIVAFAAQEGLPIEQFVAVAAAEKMAAMRTLDYLRREAAAGRREDFESFLAAVPSREPTETDQLLE
jgi:hypothetical protein